MPFILGTNSIKDTGFDVANSLRFNDGSSDYLTRSFGATQTSTAAFTISVWVKRSTLGTRQSIFAAYDGSADAGDDLEFETDDTLSYNGCGAGANTTSAKFRDVGAWYHIVLARNSGASGGANQVKIYVNGTLQTLSANNGCNVSQFLRNGLNSRIGANQNGSQYFVDMYMAEFVAIDGQMLDATSFGEFDSDSPTIWKPIDVSGLTFGNNGFYLDFENSGSLGADVSGNSNNFTVNNLTSVDQSTDTCTNNFATMNPLDNFYPASTFTEGNLKIVSGSSPYSSNTSTFGLSSGKWYYEFKYLARGGSEDLWHVGIKSTQDTANDQMLGHFANDYGYRAYNGKVRNNNGDITYGNTFAINDIIGVYIDLDNSKLYFAKNGTVQNSGTGISITAVASTPLGVYLPAISWNDGSTTGTCSLNFGSPEFSISSGNTDANGYGNFEYDPSSGTFDSASKSFYAINTKNLAEFG